MQLCVLQGWWRVINGQDGTGSDTAAPPIGNVGVIFLAKRGTQNEVVFLISTKPTFSKLWLLNTGLFVRFFRENVQRQDP